MKQVFGFLTSALFLVILVYVVLQWLNIEIGTFLDWGVGVASLLWLIVIVTVPWDAHFRASEVLHDAKISQRKELLVIDESLKYVRKISRNSLIIAVLLHIFSAIALYFVAASGISPVGYFSAIAAILLTFLRPSVRFYEFLHNKLRNIQKEFRYPREDLRELLLQFDDIQSRMKCLESQLSDDPEDNSWKKQMIETHEELWKELQKKGVKIEETDTKYAQEIQRLRTESQQHYDKVASDIKFLDSVREIANFIRELK